MAWTFDSATGVAKNRELTDRLTMAAIRMAGINSITELSRAESGYDGRSAGFNEHAGDIVYHGLLETASLDNIISQLAPSLAALFTIGVTEFVLFPEIRASIPSNLGQLRVIAWYALTMKPKSLCAAPKRHAPGCECATL